MLILNREETRRACSGCELQCHGSFVTNKIVNILEIRQRENSKLPHDTVTANRLPIGRC